MRFRIGKRRSTGLRLSALASVLAEGEGRWSGARQDEETCGIGVPCDGAPDRIRTYDLSLRRVLLYPAELGGRDRVGIISARAPGINPRFAWTLREAPADRAALRPRRDSELRVPGWAGDGR